MYLSLSCYLRVFGAGLCLLSNRPTSCRRVELGLPEHIKLVHEGKDDVRAANQAFAAHRSSRASGLPSRKDIFSQDIFVKSSAQQLRSRGTRAAQRSHETSRAGPRLRKTRRKPD